jgi:putative oxidoreductase
MTTIEQLRSWSAAHHPRWLIIIRIGLGLFLMAKGINFIRDSSMLDQLLYGNAQAANNTTHWLPIIITWANLLGGFLIMIGLWTRLICLLQLPILIGAIVFINVQKGGFAPESELGLAILTLVLVLFFLIEGSGPLSLDGYFERNRAAGSHGDNLPG